jgi:hypothetical protein
MKRILTLCLVFTGLCHGSRSQTWCVPSVNASLSFGSGINNVSLNGSPAIDRDSPSGTEGYVNTNLSSTLAQNGTYTVSVGHSIGTYCADLNLKVFIDFNLDHDFYDAGEMVGSVNGGGSGVTSFAFTVPASATLGTSRMRVCEKMTPACGHSPIDPCGPDATDNAIGGWHGEIEDYTIEITGEAGVQEQDAFSEAFFTVVGHGLWLHAPVPFATEAQLSVRDLVGRELMRTTLRPFQGTVVLGELPTGVFVARISAGDRQLVQRLWSE